MKMKNMIAAALAFGALAGGPAAAQQASYPERVVKIIAGFPPGGGNDVLARLLAERLQNVLGQPFVVENRPGANGFIAFDAVRKSKPDGYTLLVGPSSGMAVNPAVYRKLPYDPLKDFAPISMVGGFPLLVTVKPDSPYKTLDDFVQAARKDPDSIDYGSAATSFQLATEMFAQQAQIKLHHIPYTGSAQAVHAVLSGEVPVTFADSSAAVPQIKADSLRALAVTTGQRISSLPDVPTVREANYPGYEMMLWSGLFAPAGTPPEVLNKLEQTVRDIVQEPGIQERLQALGIEPIGSTSEELTATMQTQIEQYKEVARNADISIDW
ncbi:Bug family tripartite tricarboxylate transporter substrate binding protein [Pusillimonas caeni]|uniref:Bug family tripartite tricarboxylate transporter substrate binding protein n=1 Tax=Pusillimonas caeni TaxID=1348472 RepID=UPI001FD84A36|nr:tripartite tricarboxylate transporter substrate binding protein [Pusillimonas caeni]